MATNVNVELAEVIKAVGNQLNQRNSDYPRLVEFIQILLNQERLPTTSDVLGKLDAIVTAFQTTNNRIAILGDSMAITAQQVADLKAALEASNATISEIAGDIAELSANNTTLTEAVANLETQLAALNDPAVDAAFADVKSAVAAQQDTLRGIADVVPELPAPEPPEEPSPVEPEPPAEPTV